MGCDMPLPLPNLDNRTYTDLVDEIRTLLPGLAPAWTDYNPSDPGMALVELMAWLTDMTLYRVNQIPEASYDTFLTLLNGPEWTRSGDLDAAIRQTVTALRERYRAVTSDDFEYLATQVWPESPAAQALGAAGRVRRARCLPRRNLAATTPEARQAQAPGHVSLIVVPDATVWQYAISETAVQELQTYEMPLTLPSTGELRVAAAWDARQAEVEVALYGPGQTEPERQETRIASFEIRQWITPAHVTAGDAWRITLQPSRGRVAGQLRLTYFPYALPQALRQDLWSWLDARRLLTTRHHVVAADYVRVAVGAALTLHEDVLPEVVYERAMAVVRTFFDPLTGGANGQGWPFGRDIFISDIYALLDNVTGVDFVEDVTLTTMPVDATREQYSDDGRLTALRLDPHELVSVDVRFNDA